MLDFHEIFGISLCVILVIGWIIKNNLYPITKEQPSDTEHLVSERISCPRRRYSSFGGRIEVNDWASKKEFGNWMKCVLALNKTRIGILSAVAVTFQTFIESFDQDNFKVFRKCLKHNKVEHIRAKANVKLKRKWVCSHTACIDIFKVILAKHIPNLEDRWMVVNNSKSQSNSDKELLNNDVVWEIGRLFTFNEFELKENTYHSLDKLDIAQIIKLLRSCKLFTYVDSARIYDSILDKRNKLMHFVDNLTTDIELTETFSLLNELLTLFSNNSECKNTIEDVKQFEKEDISVNVTSSHFKTQKEEALETQVAALKTDIPEIEQTARSLQQKLSSTSKLLKRIKEEVQGIARSRLQHIIYCERCEKEDKEVNMAAFCEDCGEYLCETCLISHDSVNKNLGHLILRHYEDEPKTPSEGHALMTGNNCKADQLVIKSHNRTVIGDICLLEIFDTKHMLVARNSENVLLVIECNTIYEWGVKTLKMDGEVVNDKTLELSLKNVSCTSNRHLLAWGSTNLCVLTLDCQKVAYFSIPNLIYQKGEACKGRSSIV